MDPNHRQNRAEEAILSFFSGVGFMYFFDRERGLRRRRRLEERVVHRWHVSKDLLNKGSKDMKNRGEGIVASLRSGFRKENVKDEVLVERVRSKLGRYVSHPHAINVESNQGVITLKGLILKGETEPLIDCLSGIKGVRQIQSLLEEHSKEERPSQLQGGTAKAGERPNLLEEKWAPSTRIIMATLGGGLALFGVRRKGFLGPLMGFMGTLAELRAITNWKLSKVFGLDSQPQIFTVRKTINFDFPIERVYPYWAKFENFSSLSNDVTSVEVGEDQKSHWMIKGPFKRTSLQWDAVTTLHVPFEIISWKTLPSPWIQNQGSIRFHRNESNGTRVDIEISYYPPFGALGHFVAKMLLIDPKSKLEKNLIQMKTRIEKAILEEEGAVQGPEVKRYVSGRKNSYSHEVRAS